MRQFLFLRLNMSRKSKKWLKMQLKLHLAKALGLMSRKLKPCGGPNGNRLELVMSTRVSRYYRKTCFACQQFHDLDLASIRTCVLKSFQDLFYRNTTFIVFRKSFIYLTIAKRGCLTLHNLLVFLSKHEVHDLSCYPRMDQMLVCWLWVDTPLLKSTLSSFLMDTQATRL